MAMAIINIYNNVITTTIRIVFIIVAANNCRLDEEASDASRMCGEMMNEYYSGILDIAQEKTRMLALDAGAKKSARVLQVPAGTRTYTYRVPYVYPLCTGRKYVGYVLLVQVPVPGRYGPAVVQVPGTRRVQEYVLSCTSTWIACTSTCLYACLFDRIRMINNVIELRRTTVHVPVELQAEVFDRIRMINNVIRRTTGRTTCAESPKRYERQKTLTWNATK
jgi:hypothetical protein